MGNAEEWRGMVGSWASEVDGASFVLGSPRGLLRKNIIGDDLVKTWAVPHERRQWRLAGRIKLPSILLIALVLALQCVSGVRALSLGSLAARRATPRTHASSPLPPVDAALFPMPGTQLVRREEPRALLTHFEYWPRSWPRWAVRLALLLRLPLKPVAKVGLRSYRVEARGGSVMGDAVGVEEGQPPAALGLLVYMHVLPRFRGKGYGDVLLALALHAARCRGDSHLLISHDDKGSGALVRWYAARGFGAVAAVERGMVARL